MKILAVILLIMIVFFLGIIFLGWIFSVPIYRGAVSDHFDGKKFVNPGDVQPMGFKDLFKWFMAPIHTSPEDAVRIHQIIKSPKTIAMHFGTFPLADDGMEEPVVALREVMEKQGIPLGDFIVLEEGGKMMLK